jgi:ABC-2 type transport system permease protein
MLGAIEAANLTSQAYRAAGGTVDEEFWTESLDRAIEAWDDPPLTVTSNPSGAIADEAEASGTVNDYAHSSAGIMVQFAMAGLIGAAELIVVERKSGTMRRLLTTPVARIEIILGHFAAMFVMILAQLTVLILFGQLLLGVEYLREPLGTLLMLLITTFWAASLGLLIGIFARTEEQIVIYTIGIMLVLSGLGGAWMPLEFTSKAFQTVGHLMPTAWAIDGFENIVVRGLGSDSVLLPAAVLLGFAVVFFAVAIWRFRFE